eukprot:GFUD01012508.1.p1 GENE.GFUD01012508.1~~GFUD01012508.1.p1  ORF type:complete len:620 (+),score=154.60 GFUD01012508.1:86-1945(+)
MLTTFNDLMENTFNQVSDILDGDFSELGMDEEGIDIEQILGTIDSRLDADSVLLEDFKLDIDAVDYGFPLSNNCESEMINTYDYKQTNNVITRENSLDRDEKGSLYPLQRDRCNTWPRQIQERTATADSSPPHTSSYPVQALACVSEEDTKKEEVEEDDYFVSSNTDSYKSATSGRRNPWGNYSYADLITEAIQSSPDRRLTLSQIYDWMVATMPYFSERADSSSSAGWKNSIRHNLSLHQKFLKIPNESAGKSSWWSLNPENNQAKKPRRRATSGDIRTLQSKREKAKKRVETLKLTESLVRSSSISGLPPLSPSYNAIASQEKFRPRSNSTTSISEGFFPFFRSRNLSSASSTGQESPLPSPDFNMPANNVKRELDNITLDGLNIESEPLSEDPAHILMDFLHPKSTNFENFNSAHKIKILEPREHPYFGTAMNTSNTDVLNQSDQSFSALSYVTPLHTRDKTEQDEVRKLMIIKQLNQLTQRRFQIIEDESYISVDKKKSLESAFDPKIILLQDELNKLEREEEMQKFNQYSSASNNPYFSLYNNLRPAYNTQTFTSDKGTELTSANSNTMDIAENASDYKSDINMTQESLNYNQELKYNFSELLSCDKRVPQVFS